MEKKILYLTLIIFLSIASINFLSADEYWITDFDLNFTFHFNSSWDNQTDGFSTFSAGNDQPIGITTDGSDFWIIDNADIFVYHFDSSGNNLSTGFSTSSQTSDGIRGITNNGSDIWITDRTNDEIYHYKLDGTFVDNFDTVVHGSSNPFGIVVDGNDLWVGDLDDLFIYHFDISGNNLTGGFDISSAGVSVPRGIDMESDSSFWVVDFGDNFVYHFDSSGNNLSDGVDLSTINIGAPAGIAIKQITLSNIDITLNVPADSSKQVSDYILFNATLTPTNLNITNATLYIWDSSNSEFVTNTTIITGTSATEITWNLTNFNLGEDYHWNVKAYGNDSNFYWSASNYTFTASAFSEVSTSYNASVLETSYQGFTQSINAVSQITSASVVLWYNGTSYASTVTDLGNGDYKVTSAIDIPLTNTNGNKTFFWEWTLVTATQILKQNTTVFQQEVNKTIFQLCNATFNTPAVNFTIHNATNPYPVLNATFKSAWDHWLGRGSVKRNYSFEYTSETNYTFDFCISHNETFYVDAQIEFDGIASALNFYYLNNASISNDTQLIDLYLLDNTKATLTELETVDAARNPISNVTIQIQSYDIGTDTYYTVAMAKTSENGKDLAYLNWYDTLYKFILLKDGEVVKTTSPYKISSTPQTFEIIEEVTFEFKKFENFDYNLYYNETTKNFVLTFVKPSGVVESVCLRVIKRNITGDTQICLTCETSSSATLYCNINGYGNGTYIASFYATGSLKWIDVLMKTIGEVSGEIYQTLGNINGTVMAIIFAGVVMTFFLITPVLGIVGMLLGMLGAVALGFQPIDYASFLSISFVGGIIIWLIRK